MPERFRELIEMLMSPPDDGLPDTIYDDLTASYDGVNERATSGDARIAQFEDEVKAKDAEILALKARNYELLENSPAKDVDVEVETENTEENTGGIESLFTEKDDD